MEMKHKSGSAQSAILLHDILIRFARYVADRSRNMKDYMNILPRQLDSDYSIVIKLLMLKRDC
jgi:hypothetical protein